MYNTKHIPFSRWLDYIGYRCICICIKNCISDETWYILNIAFDKIQHF